MWVFGRCQNKERVTDDPLLRRHHTAIDIERRIRSAVNRPSETITLDDGTVVYKARFIERGTFYYILAKPDQDPKPVMTVWTREIYENYLDGVTSKGCTVYEHTRI